MKRSFIEDDCRRRLEVAVHLPPLMVVSPIECLSPMVDGVRKTLRMTLQTC